MPTTLERRADTLRAEEERIRHLWSLFWSTQVEHSPESRGLRWKKQAQTDTSGKGGVLPCCHADGLGVLLQYRELPPQARVGFTPRAGVLRLRGPAGIMHGRPPSTLQMKERGALYTLHGSAEQNSVFYTIQIDTAQLASADYVDTHGARKQSSLTAPRSLRPEAASRPRGRAPRAAPAPRSPCAARAQGPPPPPRARAPKPRRRSPRARPRRPRAPHPALRARPPRRGGA